MLSKILIFIVFLFKINFKICCNSDNCCFCFKNKNNNFKNNIDDDNINDDKKNFDDIKNEDDNKNKNDKNLDNIIKNDKIYKKDIQKSKFKWNDNNCSIKTSLLNLMIFFDNCPELFEDIKKEENIKCKRARKEALEIIKEIINIREKYLKGENLIRMEDFYKRCHDYQYKFYKEVKNEELEDIDKLKKLVEESINLADLVGFNYYLFSIVEALNEGRIEQAQNEKNIFKDFRDYDLETPDYKEYRTNFTCGCSLSILLKLLSKFVKDFFILEGNLINEYIYKGKIFRTKLFDNSNDKIILDNINKLEVNDKIISIMLKVKYGTIGHACLIFNDKNNPKKWYFDNVNNIIEVDFNDVKNKKFQKLLDIWYKKGGPYHYKFNIIEEILLIK